MSDHVDKLIDMWVEHQRNDPGEIGSQAPEWVHIQADHWHRENAAYRTIVGVQLADRALHQRMKEGN